MPKKEKQKKKRKKDRIKKTVVRMKHLYSVVEFCYIGECLISLIVGVVVAAAAAAVVVVVENVCIFSFDSFFFL